MKINPYAIQQTEMVVSKYTRTVQTADELKQVEVTHTNNQGSQTVSEVTRIYDRLGQAKDIQSHSPKIEFEA